MRLAEVIGTLSLATDAGTGMPEEHGLRAAILAVRLGELVGIGELERADAYYLALLERAGCTAEGDRMAAALGDEIEFGRETLGRDYGPGELAATVVWRARRGHGALGGVVAMARALARLLELRDVGRAQCEVADLVAARLGFDDAFRTALYQQGERWDGSGRPRSVLGSAIAPAMRLAQVALEIEIGYRLAGVSGARAHLAVRRGRSLEPRLVDGFAEVADEVCAAIDVPSLWEAFLAAEPGTPRLIDGAALDEAFAAIADFADLKSRYTRGHSSGVAALAEAAARTLGLDDTTVRDLRRAALVHDLGRVAVSAGVWDKLAPLTDAERERIRVHTRIPERVLARAPALAPIATLATLAHEHLDGNEYPRLQQPATAYADAAHVLAAADVYRALTEERPHRPALGHADAAAELTRMVEAGRLSAVAAGAVIAAAGHGVPRVEAPAGFSDRDVEVLRLIARGLTDKEIASALHVDARSAGHEVEHVLAKLDVTTRAAAAMRAMQLGVVA